MEQQVDLPKDWLVSPKSQSLVDEGTALVKRHDFTPEGYLEHSKKRVFDGITHTHWRAVVRCAGDMFAELGAGRADPEAVIADRLFQDKGTKSKWLRGRQVPKAEKVLAATVLVLQRELRQIEFPRLREVIWQTAGRTLTLVRTEDMKGPAVPLTRAHFAVVFHLTRHKDAWDFRAGGGNATRARVLSDVRERVASEFPAAGSLEFVARAVRDWWNPYLMFRTGLLWSQLDGYAT